MVDFDAGPHGIGEAGETPGLDHEFLEVDVVVGVFSAIEDVHHGYGEGFGAGSAEVAVEWEACGFGGGLGDGHGDAEDGVGAEFSLVGGSIELDHELVDGFLVAGVEADEFRGDFGVDVVDGFEDALAHELFLVVVAEFAGLVFAGAGAGGDGGAAEGAVFQNDIDLDGRIAAGVKNLASLDEFDIDAHVGCLESLRA